MLQAKTGPAAENYTYDKVGNRLSGPTVIDIAGESYVHDDANRMMHGRKLTYEYDELGNQTKRIFSNEVDDYAAFEQHWDGAGQLKKVELVRDKGAGEEVLRRTTFKYDPFGRRTEIKVVYRPDTTAKTVVTTYVYDREDIVFTLVDDDATEVKTHYVHGPGIDEPLAMVRDGSAYYYHADGLGSIVAITDANAQVVQRYSYESFGRMKASNRSFKNFYTYTGREWNKSIGLYYYRARYYDPMDGRFISKDPIGFAGGDVNLYRYVGNSPVVWVDPWGLWRSPYSPNPTLMPLMPGDPSHVFDQNGELYALDDDGCYRRVDVVLGEVPLLGPGGIRGLLGRGFPTRLNRGGIPQPYDPSTGRYLPYSANPGFGMSPIGRFSSGFSQGLAGSTGATSGATPIGTAGNIGHAIGSFIGSWL